MPARFAIALRPWAETERAFREGQIDMTAMVVTEERRSRVRFTTGFATPAFGVYRLPDQPEPQGLQDMAGLRIAVRDSDGMRDARSTWLAGVPPPTSTLPTPARRSRPCCSAGPTWRCCRAPMPSRCSPPARRPASSPAG